MPYLAQLKMRTDFERKRSQIYLEKELERMRVRAGYREEEQVRAGNIARGLETLGMMTESVKGLARPELELRRRAPISGIETGLLPYDPEQAEREMAPTEDVMQHMAKTFEEGKFMLPEKIALATRILPLETITERPLEIEKAKAGREQREIAREKTKLGWAELGVKKKGEGKKKIEDLLKYEAKNERILVDELGSIEDLSGLMEGDPEYDDKNKQIADSRQKQKNYISQLKGELDKKKADKIIAKLRANKIKIRVLEKNKEKFMKEENLTEAEYHYIRLNL